MLPISAESRIVIDSSAGSSPGSGVRLWNSASAISATAPPPTPLNRATICGIAVIFTERAPTTPITAPIAIASPIQTKLPSPSWASVTAIASAIPAAPSRFPWRARFGEERKRSARMKVTIVTR